jgi:hypothetical protein
MGLKIWAVVIIITWVPGYAFCQGYPFEVPSDPRSVAMGESFVGLPSNPAALMYNPAGLAGLSGLSVLYSRKSLDWISQGWSLYSISVAGATSFGVFAAQYNRNSLGSMPITTVQFPDGNGSEMTLYSHDVALGYAYRLPVGLALGASAKYYDFVETISGSLNGGTPAWESTPAYLFDFGLTYTLPRLHSQATVEDSITLGMSYQNIGSRWKVEYPPSPGQHTLVGVYQGVQETQLPEYFRIGLSYALRIRPTEDGGLSPFAAILTGEFRSLQAPLPDTYTLYPSGAPYPETSYWGLGFECTFFEILSIRSGAAFRPFDGVEGDRDRPSFRYGAGVNLPLHRIGIGLPLTASVQYTVVPVIEHGYYLSPGDRTGTLPVFSIDIQYTGSPW